MLSPVTRVAYLDFFVGVKEHDTDERENFLSGAITGPCEVRQRHDHGSHVVQFHLNASNQHHLPAITADSL